MQGVRHPIDEQISIVNGSVAFTQTPYAINPGNAKMFPLLSKIATNYERYEFQDLQFCYNPSQNVFSAQGTAGFVDISVTNDATQAPPSSQAIAEVLYHAGPAQTAEALCLKIPKGFLDPIRGLKKFVRPNGLIPGGTDPHEYDAGQIFFWTLQQAAGTAIGELKVKGHVMLYNQVLETSTTPPVNFDTTYLMTDVFTALPGTGVAGTIPFADVKANNLSVVNNAGQITLPVGNYKIDYHVNALQSVANASLYIQTLLFKNATNLQNSGNSSAANAGFSSLVNVAGATFVSSNGSDAISLAVEPIYTAGAPTYSADIIIMAI